MDGLDLDCYGRGKLSPSRVDLPSGAVFVAAAVVSFEGLGTRESYWLTPPTDGAAEYELWSRAEIREDETDPYDCCGRLRPATNGTAVEAARTLLAALWSARYPPALFLSKFEREGLLSRRDFDDLEATYQARLKPPKARRGSVTTKGELHYEDGTLRHRGEIRDGLAHGKGTGYWGNGRPWCEGQFRHNRPHGQCRIYFKNGTLRYVGTMVDGMPLGRGKEYFKNGGLWFAGIFGPQGSYYNYGARNWRRGSLYNEDGHLVYKGEFRYDGKHSYPKESKGRPILVDAARRKRDLATPESSLKNLPWYAKNPRHWVNLRETDEVGPFAGPGCSFVIFNFKDTTVSIYAKKDKTGGWVAAVCHKDREFSQSKRYRRRYLAAADAWDRFLAAL